MKKNVLGRLMVLCITIAGINLLADPLHEREKQYQQGKYFVYAQGTSNGILIDQAWLEQHSEMVKSMVGDLGGRPKEITVPFSIENIKLAFDLLNNKVDLIKPSREQFNGAIAVEQFLLVPQEVINKTVMQRIEMLKKDATLDDLVEAFNKMSDSEERKMIFKKIIEVVNNIIFVILTQSDMDAHGTSLGALSSMTNLFGESKAEDYPFREYKGRMVPVTSTINSLRIPDYTVLSKIMKSDEDSLQQYKILRYKVVGVLGVSTYRNLGMSDEALSVFTPEHFKKDRLVDFVNALFNKVNEFDAIYKKHYDALSLHQKALRGFRKFNAFEIGR